MKRKIAADFRSRYCRLLKAGRGRRGRDAAASGVLSRGHRRFHREGEWSYLQYAGDAVLAEFPSAVDAVRCAIDIQESLRTRNMAYPPSRQMSFRIGITIGDVVERDGDLLGDGVNIAARLEGLAEVGGICVSRAVHEQVANKLSVQFADIGAQEVKNIPTPVHAYMVAMRRVDGTYTRHKVKKVAKAAPPQNWMWPLVVGVVSVVAIGVGGFLYFTKLETTKEHPPPPRRAESGGCGNAQPNAHDGREGADAHAAADTKCHGGRCANADAVTTGRIGRQAPRGMRCRSRRSACVYRARIFVLRLQGASPMNAPHPRGACRPMRPVGDGIGVGAAAAVALCVGSGMGIGAFAAIVGIGLGVTAATGLGAVAAAEDVFLGGLELGEIEEATDTDGDDGDYTDHQRPHPVLRGRCLCDLLHLWRGIGPVHAPHRHHVGVHRRRMFLTSCAPISANCTDSLLATCSCTARETQMPPTSARPSSRAAMLTPSPRNRRRARPRRRW